MLRGPEISLYSTLVLSYEQYSLPSRHLSSKSISDLNHDLLLLVHLEPRVYLQIVTLVIRV